MSYRQCAECSEPCADHETICAECVEDLAACDRINASLQRTEAKTWKWRWSSRRKPRRIQRVAQNEAESSQVIAHACALVLQRKEAA